MNNLPPENASNLSKREYFAAIALQGLLANSTDVTYWDRDHNRAINNKYLCEGAIKLADEMIRQLAETDRSLPKFKKEQLVSAPNGSIDHIKDCWFDQNSEAWVYELYYGGTYFESYLEEKQFKASDIASLNQ